MKKTLVIVLSLALMLTMLSGCNLLKKEPTLQDVLIGEWTLSADVRTINGFIPEESRALVSVITAIANVAVEPLTMNATFYQDGTMHLELSQGADWLNDTLDKMDGFLGTDMDSILGKDGGLFSTIMNVVESGVGDFHYYTVEDQLYVWSTWQTEENALIFTCEQKENTIVITEISDGYNLIDVPNGAFKLTRVEEQTIQQTQP